MSWNRWVRWGTILALGGGVVIGMLPMVFRGKITMVQSDNSRNNPATREEVSKVQNGSGVSKEEVGNHPAHDLHDKGRTEQAAQFSLASSTVVVDSEPPRAEVIWNGVVIGHTPIQLKKPREGEEKMLVLKSDGYRPVKVVLSPKTITGVLKVRLEADTGYAPMDKEGYQRASNKTLPHPSPSPRSASQREGRSPGRGMSGSSLDGLLDPWR
ncbi:MAG: PEGA domain-containing protein [Sandaracinaceae bacterium]|nr:PEGA domain-containing protein [Sandaracinaceae bacterium]